MINSIALQFIMAQSISKSEKGAFVEGEKGIVEAVTLRISGREIRVQPANVGAHLMQEQVELTLLGHAGRAEDPVRRQSRHGDVPADRTRDIIIDETVVQEVLELQALWIYSIVWLFVASCLCR